MTKAKIVVAAKVGHRVVVRVPVADAALARAAMPQHLAAFIKPAHLHRVAHRVTRRAKRPFVPAVQQNHAERARIQGKSARLSREATDLPVTAPFHPVRPAKARVRASALLLREVIAQQGIARTAIARRVIGPIRPAPRGKVLVMKSVPSRREVKGPQASVQEAIGL